MAAFVLPGGSRRVLVVRVPLPRGDRVPDGDDQQVLYDHTLLRGVIAASAGHVELDVIGALPLEHQPERTAAAEALGLRGSAGDRPLPAHARGARSVPETEVDRERPAVHLSLGLRVVEQPLTPGEMAESVGHQPLEVGDGPALSPNPLRAQRDGAHESDREEEHAGQGLGAHWGTSLDSPYVRCVLHANSGWDVHEDALTALVAHGHFDELALHGLSEEEIKEVLRWGAIYSGVLAANQAFKVRRGCWRR